MKKILRQELSAVLCLLLIACTVFGAVPQSKMEVQAAGEEFVINKNGCLTNYNGSGGDVIIPDTVTSIGNYAFMERRELTSVTIPSSVTRIGENAFFGCSGLTNVTISEGVTRIEDWAFGDCRGLRSIEIPSSVRSIGVSAFSGCSGLTSIEIPSSVTSIKEGAFGNCGSLERISVAEGNPIYHSKDDCNAIVEEDNSLIAGCKNTKILPSVTSIDEYAFSGCSGLTSIEIPSSVTSIGNRTFSGCSGLTSIEIPSSVTSIGTEAFGDCSGLERISVAEENSTYHSKEGCNAIVIKDNSWMTVWQENNTLIAGCKNTKILPSVTSIDEYAFSGCSGLVSIEIPSSVKSIGQGAFSGCSGLASIEIPSSVKSIGESAFSDCSGLASVTISEGITNIGEWTFSGCSGLTSLEIPSNVKSIENAAFWRCSGLTSVTISEGVTSIGEDAFWECNSLTSLEIPSSMASIGEHAFANCIGLKSVTISEGVTNIGQQVFENCIGLKSVTVPSSVKRIENWTFSGCGPELTIYGEKGSYAETYAKKNNIRFSTGKVPQPPAKKDILDNKVTITLSQTSYIYDGQAKKPAITVKDGDKVLTEGTDYTVTYQDNTNVGTAKVIVAGQGNYTGTVTKPFTITEAEQKKTIGDDDVILSQTSYVYDGQAKKPAITVKDGDKVLTEGTDYTVTYQDNTNVGTAKVIVAGQGNYTGTVTKPFTITEAEQKKTIGDNDVTLSQTSYTYDGQAKKPAITVKDGDKVLTEGTDYTVTYQDNTNVGTAKVIVAGQGNYTGTVTKPFTITEAEQKKTLLSKNVTLKQTSYAYDGKAKKPAVTVKDGTTVLKAGTDYTVVYQNNKNAGKAKVIIKGKGSYQGTVTKTFTIAVKKNTSHRVGSYQYKVTGTSTVSLTAIKDNKVTKVKVPKTVKIGGKTFKVTAVGSNAFKKNKKITTVEIGDNVKIIGTGVFESCMKLNKVTVGKGVTEIGKNVFKNCKKLGNITIKSTKLKKVGKNALRGIKPTARIKVPAKKISAYQKLFKNKGQGKKVKVVR